LTFPAGTPCIVRYYQLQTISQALSCVRGNLKSANPSKFRCQSFTATAVRKTVRQTRKKERNKNIKEVEGKKGRNGGKKKDGKGAKDCKERKKDGGKQGI
jgi:hypothetical protein